MIDFDQASMAGLNGNDMMVAIGHAQQSGISMTGVGGTDTFILALDATESVGANFEVEIKDFTAGEDRIDLSDLRDAAGNVLDLQDLLDHATVNFLNRTEIDLSSFTSAAGDHITGTLTINNVSDPSTLTAADFVFTGGVDWQAMVPQDVNLFA